MKSTNGRADQWGQGIRRRSTRVLSELWPGLVARWAEQVFLTPGRKTLSPAEQVMLATGHRFSVPVAGKRLAAWSWGDGPTVFLVHGWGSSAGRMTSFVDPLVRAGFSAVAFDGPGHGESEGTTSSIVEMAQALRAMTEWTAAADSVRGHAGAIGHSMGGGAIALASHHGLVFKRAVFLATPADLETPSREFAARETGHAT
jgi:alpha-beta hydrolase superfamily lysophospholipase